MRLRIVLAILILAISSYGDQPARAQETPSSAVAVESAGTPVEETPVLRGNEADAPADTPPSEGQEPSEQSDESGPSSTQVVQLPASTDEEEDVVVPWDFDPYRILIWVASDDPNIHAGMLENRLRRFLERDYQAAWRVTVADAPQSVASAAKRDLGGLSFDTITAADPVIALKRNHKDAVRIRAAANIFQYVEKVHGTAGLIEDVKRRAKLAGDQTLSGAAKTLTEFDGDAFALQKKWADEETDAVLVQRGVATELYEAHAALLRKKILAEQAAGEEPILEDDEIEKMIRKQAVEAKIIGLPIANLVMTDVDQYDKIFIAVLRRNQFPNQVSVIEFNTLMRYMGAVYTESFVGTRGAADALGRAVYRAFTPEVRIDEAGLKEAKGLVRAGGLFTDPNSPGLVRMGDVLLPMVRKNDRNGRPIMIGPLDWAFLLSVKQKPKANDDGFRVNGPDSITIHVLTNDEEPEGKPLKVTKIYGRDVEPGQFVDVPNGKATLNEDYTITFEPKDPENYEAGSTEFAYDISNGELSSRAKITDNPAVPETAPKEESEENTEETVIPNYSRVTMEFYSGRTGGLQGRQNKRTFRRALRIRPEGKETLIRLHAKGDENSPLIGYELYEKELYSKKMTFVGRTDWNGRLNIPVTSDKLRLMYVKNGGAVLARLPLVPGFTPREVADITGDDMRLQAEAYVSGVANAIIDLVAIRKLLGARIRNRLKKGQLDEARKMLESLRAQPTKDILGADMDVKQAFFLSLIPARSYNARSKVDSMFKSTREMLDKQISQKFIRAVEEDFIRAESNGGTLPEDPVDEDAVDSSVNMVSDAEEK